MDTLLNELRKYCKKHLNLTDAITTLAIAFYFVEASAVAHVMLGSGLLLLADYNMFSVLGCLSSYTLFNRFP